MNQPKPSPELFNRIIAEIEKEQRIATLRRNIAYSAVFLVLSVFGFGLSSREFVSEATRSGMFDFIRLAFSDARVISQNFNELSLSLLQSLPIDTFAVAVALLAAIMGSAYSLIQSLQLIKE